jgi:hypothetical protein
METQIGSAVEEVTKSDILGLELASWNRQRTKDQLMSFIARREAQLSFLNNDEQ